MALGSTQPLKEMIARNISFGGKGGRCIRRTALPLSRVDCLEIWELQRPGNFVACPGLERGLPYILHILSEFLGGGVAATLSFGQTDNVLLSSKLLVYRLDTSIESFPDLFLMSFALSRDIDCKLSGFHFSSAVPPRRTESFIGFIHDPLYRLEDQFRHF